MRSILAFVPLLGAASLLAGCGYTPLYAPDMGAATASQHLQVGSVEMASVKRNVGERRVAQIVAQELKLSYPETAVGMDTLVLSIEETTTELAVESTAAIQRAQLSLTGTLEITAPGGARRLRTTVAVSTAYNVESTPYSTESGKTFARQTAARNLAAEVSRRVALFYRTTAGR